MSFTSECFIKCLLKTVPSHDGIINIREVILTSHYYLIYRHPNSIRFPTNGPYNENNIFLVQNPIHSYIAFNGHFSLITFCLKQRLSLSWCCMTLTFVQSTVRSAFGAASPDASQRDVSWGACCAWRVGRAQLPWSPPGASLQALSHDWRCHIT